MTTREYRWRHLALLIAILLVFIVTPFALAFSGGAILLRILSALVIIAASYALSDRRTVFVVAIILTTISLVASGLLWAFQQPWAVEFAHGCLVVLLLFFLVNILAYVLRGEKVNADKIFAGICVYLLIGYSFAFSYALLDQLAPDSFAPRVESSSYVLRGMQMRYLSFTTLTTLGYGDVVPRSPVARTLAMLEALTGQIYLAVLIARLVGLHIVHGLEQRDKDDHSSS